MLQQVLLSPGLRGQAVCPAVTRLLPTLRHVRAYGFGSHVSDNDPGRLPWWVRQAELFAQLVDLRPLLLLL
jgi:hypothetical protein